MPTPLQRPLVRRVGNLVVQIAPDGIALRGYRRRTWRKYTWQQVASLAHDNLPLVRTAEHAAGSAVLAEMLRNHSLHPGGSDANAH